MQNPGRNPKLYVFKTSGDKTGLFYVSQGTIIHIEPKSIRTQPPVNFEVKQGGFLELPLFTELSGSRTYSLNTEGHVYGVEELHISKSLSARFSISGQSSCYGCSLPISQGQYWFKRLRIENSAKAEMSSESLNVKTKTIVLHIQTLDVQGAASINADVMNMFTDFLKIQYDAKIDSSSRGYRAYQGPGYHSGCGSTAGAGHGGDGGYGNKWGCVKCSQPGLF